MSDAEIIDLFDSSNITMHQLSIISGRPIAYLKQILMT